MVGTGTTVKITRRAQYKDYRISSAPEMLSGVDSFFPFFSPVAFRPCLSIDFAVRLLTERHVNKTSR